MHVFGLTGGIASGKSAVLAVFRAEGVATVDADEMAREVVKPGSDGLVASPRPLQHARLLARDGLSPAEADARLDSQAPLEAKLAAADVVIWNDADLPTLETRAREALGRVKQLVAASS